jgi:hypothetical protein
LQRAADRMEERRRDDDRQRRANALSFALDGRVLKTQLAKISATMAPRSCAATKAGTLAGAIPAKLSESARAMVTAGLANEVEAVNQ